ncbi:tape measure domain-containing protein [Amphibacillus marinus]|uniref:Tape measure domain-containing protein n=1 Tax=Amphibacillus marinus TaxID=872970 RepID=A0A1H8IZ09_9BACI|nr:tape measure protein [Amphibacillus marinus]SEN73599.1 tape measure domain-containing protein [Amphibacillus marinus]
MDNNAIARSIKLFESFGSVIQQFNKGLANAIDNFEKFQVVLDKGCNSAPTPLSQGFDKANQIDFMSREICTGGVDDNNDLSLMNHASSLSQLELSYQRISIGANRYASMLLVLRSSMGQMIQLQSSLGNNKGLNLQQTKLQRAAEYAQMLINRFKQTSPPIIALSYHISRVKDHITQSALAQSRFGQVIGRSLGFIGRLTSSAARLPGAWVSLIPIIGQAIKKQYQLRTAIQTTAKGQQKFNGLSFLKGIGNAIKTVRQFAQLLGAAASQADLITQSMRRVSNITNSDQSLDQLNDNIMASSIDARTPWQETAAFVAKVAQTSGGLFANNDEVVGFTNLLQKSFKAGGASAEEQKSSMTQLAQALQKGVLSGQELNSIMTDAPMIVDAITNHLGITKSELSGIADEGQLSAQLFKDAMFAAATDINNKFQEIPMTWGEMWAQTKNIALYAFMPLIESFNAFINSDVGQQIFESISTGFVMLAEVASWVFAFIVIGLTWLQENIEKVMTFFTILGVVIATVALIVAISWAIANWPIILMILLIMALVNFFESLGITASDILGFIAGTFAFLGVLIYDVIIILVGIFEFLFQLVTNGLIGIANLALAAAEFFANSWNNSIYNVRKAAHAMITFILDIFAKLAEGSGETGLALANAFVNGANMAIKGINWLIDAINEIPGISLGKISTMDNFGSSAELGDQIRGLVDHFDPGDEPEQIQYKRFKYLEMDGLSKVGDKLKNPNDAFNKAYEKGSNLGNNANGFMDSLTSKMSGDLGLSPSTNSLGNIGDGTGDKIGKGKEIGDIGKIKSEVSINDEDLKYLRDIAERNFIIRYQQLSPNATVNLYGSNNKEQDAKKLLEEMEILIEAAAATNLA